MGDRFFKVDEEYDVAIVGSGPAGSTTAENCAKKGLKTLVLDRNLEIGTPVRCGEGLSENTVKQIGYDLPSWTIAQNIDGAIVYAPNGKAIEIRFEGTKGYVLRRKMFDKWLAMRAGRAGVDIVAKSEVKEILKQGDQITGINANVIGQNHDIKAKVVVAADGAESIMMRQAGLRSYKNPRFTDTGYQYEMVNVDMSDNRMIHLWFGTRIAPRGYVWVFPKGNDVANVGVGIGALHGSGKTAKQYLDEWIASEPGYKKGAILEVNGGAIPVGGFMKPESMVTNGLIGVGDAVSQVNPIHGGGIGESIKAGRIAADVLKNAVEKNDLTKQGLLPYATRWWSEHGERLRKVEKVREIFEKWDDDRLNAAAEVLNGEDLEAFGHGQNLPKLVKLYAKFQGQVWKKKIGDKLGFGR